MEERGRGTFLRHGVLSCSASFSSSAAFLHKVKSVLHYARPSSSPRLVSPEAQNMEPVYHGVKL